MTRAAFLFVLATTLLAATGHVASAQTPAQIVKERQDAMKANWGDYYKAIAQTLRSPSPDLGVVAAKSAQAADHVKKFYDLFPRGTGRDAVPATRAKPEVWAQKSDFDAALKALVDTTTTMGDDAKKGDLEKVKLDWTATAKACGACHGGPEKSGGKFRFEEK